MIHMRRVSQEMQVDAAAVGVAIFSFLEHNNEVARPRYVNEGRATTQLGAGGLSASLAVLKVDENLGEHAIMRSLRVRARGLHDDVAHGPLLRLERPVAAVAGVDENDKTMAVLACGAPLHINVSEEESSASSPCERTCHRSTTCL